MCPFVSIGWNNGINSDSTCSELSRPHNKQTPLYIHRIFSSLYFFHSFSSPNVRESGKCLLVESGIPGFGIRNTAQGIRILLTAVIPSPSSSDIDSNPVPGIRNPRRGIQNSRLSRVSLHRGSSVNKYEGLFLDTGHPRWPDISLLHTPRVAPCRSLNFLDSL